MKKPIIASLLCLLTFASCTSGNAKDFNIMDYGAKNDSTVLSTLSVQKAIDAATKKGGRVVVPEGNFQIATIEIKDNVELHIQKGGQLMGCLDIEAYRKDVKQAIEAPALNRCLIYADGAKNIKITGEGRINGRGHRANFPIGKKGAYNQRPMLLRMVECKNIEFTDITFMNSGAWTLHLIDCDDLVARRVKIDCQVNRNNDGFDLDGCQRVLIEDCDIKTGDDALCPKSTTARPCEDITIRNCRVTSHTSAFKCGTSSRSGFKNISVTNCHFYDVGMGAIKIQLVDGGVLENITISDITMENVDGPIFFRLGNRGRMYDKPIQQKQGQGLAQEGGPMGSMKNVVIKNIKATIKDGDPKRWGMMLTGIPGHYIENILLENIDITYPGGVKKGEFKTEVAEDETRYPEQFFFGVLPSWGAYIRHAKNVTFKNVNMKTVKPDDREKFVFVDVVDFKNE